MNSSRSPSSTRSSAWTVSPMRWIGDAVVLVVVGADLLRPPAALHLLLARRGQRLVLLLLLELQQPGAQDRHRALTVLQLTALVLAARDEAGGNVREAHRRVGRVHRLAAGPARPEHVHLDVLRVDLDIDLVGFGKHGHRRRAGVDAPLALGLRHPLHAVRTALVLQPRPRRRALHDERDVAEAAVVGQLAREHLELEPVGLAVALVHAEEVGRPRGWPPRRLRCPG